jgi:hypothetical protein
MFRTAGRCPHCRAFIFFKDKPFGGVWRCCPSCQNELVRPFVSKIGDFLIFVMWGVSFVFGLEFIKSTFPDINGMWIELSLFFLFVILFFGVKMLFGYRKPDA